jgi:hypothetical protein
MSAATALTYVEKLTEWCRVEIERAAVESFELLRDRICESVHMVVPQDIGKVCRGKGLEGRCVRGK